MVVRHCLSPPLPAQVVPTGGLKSAVVGVFTPQRWDASTNQGSIYCLVDGLDTRESGQRLVTRINREMYRVRYPYTMNSHQSEKIFFQYSKSIIQ